jgi:fatty acid/phospholipid biosynthesis enzyme
MNGNNGKYMASSRTQMLIRITNINKPQIVSKMPNTAICYIHC